MGTGERMNEPEEIYPEWIKLTSKRIAWYHAMEALNLMKAYREEQAAAVARRLLGNQIAGETITSVCNKARKFIHGELD